MPTVHRYFSVRHRRMSQLLRRLRENSELTRDEVAERMEWYPSKISKLETGDWKRLQARDVRGLLDIYGITNTDEQDSYVQLAKDARKPGWWTRYGEVANAHVAMEDEASMIQAFETCYIPGLLQTERYARALVNAAVPGVSEAEAELRISMRMERKRILDRPNSPKFWSIVDEAALHRPVGDGDIMREQLEHLQKVTSEYVGLQVIPFAAGIHPGMDGAFAILDFPHPLDQPAVFLESARDGLYLEDDEAIERYRVMFDYLRAIALGPAESLRLMREVVSSL